MSSRPLDGIRILDMTRLLPGPYATLVLADLGADVVVEGFRPGVMDRLGIGWGALSLRNPRLSLCSLSGYGQNGPLAQRAGHDIGYNALAGVLGVGGPKEGCRR